MPKTANATRFVSRCSSSSADDTGDPIRMRFKTEYTPRAWHDDTPAPEHAGFGTLSCGLAGS